MGLNAYLEAVGSVGYTAGAATDTNAAINISGKPGKRIAILSYGFQETDSVVPAIAYFMRSIEATTIGTAAASGATTITVTTMTNTPATAAWVCAVLDDGTYQFTTVRATASTTSIPLTTNLTDTSAAGNAVYYLGAATTTGQYRVNQATAGTQENASSDIGLVFGSTKGSPMRVEVSDSTGTQIAEIDYVSYGYLNV